VRLEPYEGKLSRTVLRRERRGNPPDPADQSTINPNIPLRLLEYIAEIYKRYVSHKKIFGTTLIKIPWPEFIVFYNGVTPYHEEATLKLSDAFEQAEAYGIDSAQPPSLELIVKVYNINPGKNE
jgi:hypothetical protein